MHAPSTSPSPGKISRFHKAIFFMVIAYASIVVMGVFVKISSDNIPPSQILFFRFFIGLLFVLPFVLNSPQFNFKIRNFKYSLLRNVAGLLSMFLMFYSFKYLSVSTAILLTNSSTLFVPLFMLLIFKNRTSWSTILYTVLGFAGICISFYTPQAELSSLYVLIGVLGAAFAALAYIGIKQLSKDQSPLEIIFCFYVSSSVAIPLFTAYGWVWPSWGDTLSLLMVGIFGLFFQLFVIKAFRLSDIGEITPFIFSGVILSALSDWLLWSNAPSGRFWAGAAVTVLSVSLLAKSKGTGQAATLTR
jgi:drug/metabolite transporter (DMT)-like permease